MSDRKRHGFVLLLVLGLLAASAVVIALKPTLLGSEPADVRAYASAYPDFPNQTTADQFFTESQMESYRSLGAHIVETVFGDADDDDTDAPIDALAPYWRSIKKFA